jgi:hypothetical protein
MSLENQHPLYAEYVEDWTVITDTFRGERKIKEKGLLYLPATPGQIADGMSTKDKLGYKNYDAYKLRARFPDFVAQAVEAILGIMHHKPPTIDLPEQMEDLRERITIHGESLEVLLRRINEHQLVTGRVGLLADIADDVKVGTMPYIALYKAGDMINWDDEYTEDNVLRTLNLVVLNESGYERDDNFSWKFGAKFRVLLLGDIKEKTGGLYRMGLFQGDNDTTFDKSALIEPSIGGKTLDKIPFVFINSKDIVPDPDDPPLLGLAKLALTVYRGEADYRQTLFMQGQDTLVVIGGVMEEGVLRVGAGARIEVQQGGDAKYIGVSSEGLAEQRMALENDRTEAGDVGGKLLDTTGHTAESGDALRIRVSARTASLNQIALAGAEGLQSILRTIAEWIGATPDEVVVTPNTDFADDTLEGRTLVDYMTAKTLGAPLSLESIHRILQEKDLTVKTYEEEITAIEAEGELLNGTDAGGEEEEEENAEEENAEE